VKPSAFEYVRPASLPAAVAALGVASPPTPIAGGQSLLVLLRLRLTAVETLLDVGRLPGLLDATAVPGGMRYGAGCTHAVFEDDAVPDVTAGFMRAVAAGIAYRAVRTMGTIGGSLALADPAADWPVGLLALGAQVVAVETSGERRLAMDDFLVGAFTTALRPGELLAGIEVAALPPGSRWGYNKLARKHGAFADSLAACVWPEGGAPRVALGATTGHPVLLRRTMAALAGGDALSEAAMVADVTDAEPDADAFRRRCHLATVRRALQQAGVA
jgi:carbon-monoxide dehydrogenase medium subunit